MSILHRHRATPAAGSTTARERARTRRAIARALSSSPTEATRQELLGFEARL